MCRAPLPVHGGYILWSCWPRVTGPFVRRILVRLLLFLYEDSKNGKSASIHHCPESRPSMV
jgi:hypothetical protein